jgi:taurine transport system ATP-binding protein
MAPRPGRVHRDYRLPFAALGAGQDLRGVKRMPEFAERREEILSMIWDMEEEIMGRAPGPAVPA